jgi:hypothetical protein
MTSVATASGSMPLRNIDTAALLDVESNGNATAPVAASPSNKKRRETSVSSGPASGDPFVFG